MLLSSNILLAQTDTTRTKFQQLTDSIEPMEIDIIGGYYSQDGANSAVTGGRGTEDLQVVPATFIINIPSKKNNYNFNIGVDNVTSASTDNMDTDVSSASKVDTRVHGDLSYTRKVNKRKSYHVIGGFSSEYDVKSFSAGAGFAVESKNKNSSIDINGKVYYDNWFLYYPAEFRPGVDSAVLENFDHDTYKHSSGNDSRISYNFSASFAQIITPKLQIAITADFVLQTGLLATPFHRVYFNDGINNDGNNEFEDIKSDKLRKREFLPDSRMKIPVSFRFHYYISSTFIFKGFYRYYYDDFGIRANTFELELPVRFSKAFALIPFYRYHTQTASTYFAPFGEHLLTDTYFTSDYDLSAFNSTNYGLGIRFTPLFGIGRNAESKKSDFIFKSLNLRYALYDRSNSLNAYMITLGLGFTVF